MNEINKLIFHVDENDSVKRCEYIEPCYGSAFGTYNIINLPDIELHKLFYDFLKKFPQTGPKEEGNDLIFTFYDVDVDLIDSLIERSKLSDEQKRKEKFVEGVWGPYRTGAFPLFEKSGAKTFQSQNAFAFCRRV